MKHHNSVSQQLLRAIPHHQFQKKVDRHNGDHRVRKLPCWTQLVAMMFVQLASQASYATWWKTLTPTITTTITRVSHV